MRQQASELLQNLDALLCVGVGGEERCEEAHALAAAQSLRMHDEQGAGTAEVVAGFFPKISAHDGQ